MVLTVSGVGKGWFSGETREGNIVGAVIPLTSVHTLTLRNLSVRASVTARTEAPIAWMLLSLMRLRKRVVVNSSAPPRRGLITRVGSDYLALSQAEGRELLIPFSAISWIEVP